MRVRREALTLYSPVAYSALRCLTLPHQVHQLERRLVGERQGVLEGFTSFWLPSTTSSLVIDAPVIKESSCPLRKTAIQVSSYRSRLS